WRKAAEQLACDQLLYHTYGVGKILLASAPSTIRSCLRQMERSRHWACTFSLLAARFAVASQCSPDGFPILCSRFHHDFLDLVLDQPCGQQSQRLRIATVSDPFKLVLPLNVNVGHDPSQTLS